MPIIVGGTNYYIESILWDTLIGSNIADDETTESDDSLKLVVEEKIVDIDQTQELNSPQLHIQTLEDLLSSPITFKSLELVPNETLHNFLSLVDPPASQMVHVSNRRKVIRFLQIYQQFGRPYSEVLKDQHKTEGASRFGGPLKFTNSILLWVDCDKNGNSWRDIANIMPFMIFFKF